MIALGMMSGTSLDGIDSVLISIRPDGAGYALEQLDFATTLFEPALQDDLRALLPPSPGDLQNAARRDREIGEAYAEAAAALAGDRKIDYVSMHGQTVYHDGDRAITLQFGWPYFVRDRLRASVCFDFRTADCALNGHGAPLVPYVDALLLSSPDEDRVAVNIGGIANLTFLPRGGGPEDAIAFDSGPGNMLIDLFVRHRTQGTQAYDAGGELALRGRVDVALLGAFLRDPYFAAPPPKSTGRERFGSQFLRNDAFDALSVEDGAATLTALTAASLARAIDDVAPPGTRVLVSGGGARNRAILRALQERLDGSRVETTDTMNLSADAKEAVAFAVFGYETLRGRPANLPRVTGASSPTVLGSIAPYRLAELLARVQAACRA